MAEEDDDPLISKLYAEYPHAFTSREALSETVQYTPGGSLIPPGVTCVACGAAKGLVADHCHEHGWTRAWVCRSCNRKLGYIDRRIMPRATTDELLVALLKVRNRCPDCGQLTRTDLTPS